MIVKLLEIIPLILAVCAVWYGIKRWFDLRDPKD